MIVVADASPLNYLIQIESDDILQRIFERVFIPTAVWQELRDARGPERVKAWLGAVPAWLEVCGVGATNQQNLLALDAGEREAILLAEQLKANLLLIDEKRGRAEAERHGIASTGTFGVLLEAGKRKLLDPEAAFRPLVSETTFRATVSVRQQFLEEWKGLEK